MCQGLFQSVTDLPHDFRWFGIWQRRSSIHKFVQNIMVCWSISLTESDTEIKDEAPSEHLQEKCQLMSCSFQFETPIDAYRDISIGEQLTPVIGLIGIMEKSLTRLGDSRLWCFITRGSDR